MRKLLIPMPLLMCASAAHAHMDTAASTGFLAGFMHPLSGLDHLLAMIAVGIWGAALGGRLLWAMPVTFPLLMVLGGYLGIMGVALPLVEPGIAASVVVLGLAILTAWRTPAAVALALVALFGMLHGFAHGMELPGAASPAAYSLGFVASTGMLHLAGIAIGKLQLVPHGRAALRFGGAAIAASGVWILAGMQGFA